MANLTEARLAQMQAVLQKLREGAAVFTPMFGASALHVQAIEAFSDALTEIETLKGENERLKHLLVVAAADLRSFTKGTTELYALSEEIRDAAIKHLPMGNGPWDRAVAKHIGSLGWQEEASKAIQAIRAVVGGDQMPDIASNVEALKAQLAARDAEVARLTEESLLMDKRWKATNDTATRYLMDAAKAEAALDTLRGSIAKLPNETAALFNAMDMISPAEAMDGWLKIYRALGLPDTEQQ